MGKAVKQLKKQGRVNKEAKPLAEFLDFDLSNPDEAAQYQKYQLLQLLHEQMIKKDISKSELARRMGVTRQAVTNKFLGEALSLDWLMRAFSALGLVVDFKVKKARVSDGEEAAV